MVKRKSAAEPEGEGQGRSFWKWDVQWPLKDGAVLPGQGGAWGHVDSWSREEQRPRGRGAFGQVVYGQSRESEQREMKQRNKAVSLSVPYFHGMNNQQMFIIERLLSSQVSSVRCVLYLNRTGQPHGKGTILQMEKLT